jgi:hypothetical protein
MRNRLFVALLLTLTPSLASAQGNVSVTVDSARREIVLSVGPLTIPPSMPYEHHGVERYHVIPWPVSGWMRGYRVDFRSQGVTRRDLLHHVGLANVDRRQVASPIAERILAAAHETAPVTLPMSLGVPLTAGHRMVLYYALVNPDTVAVTDAVLEIRMPWIDARMTGVTTLVPFYASSRPDTARTISFDVPAAGCARRVGTCTTTASRFASRTPSAARCSHASAASVQQMGASSQWGWRSSGSSGAGCACSRDIAIASLRSMTIRRAR